MAPAAQYALPAGRGAGARRALGCGLGFGGSGFGRLAVAPQVDDLGLSLGLFGGFGLHGFSSSTPSSRV